jgi:hypothetical protein
MSEPDPIAARRLLLHLDDGRRVPLDPAEIFLLAAKGDETVVRTSGRRPLRDVRSLGELMRRLRLASEGARRRFRAGLLASWGRV